MSVKVKLTVRLNITKYESVLLNVYNGNRYIEMSHMTPLNKSWYCDIGNDRITFDICIISKIILLEVELASKNFVWRRLKWDFLTKSEFIFKFSTKLFYLKNWISSRIW